jgi:phosphatidylserine/phosphatidylglycerophosphate/cardiolipin synthase-like enzyme
MVSRVTFCSDYQECVNSFVKLIKGAEKELWYSTFLCNLTTPLPGHGQLTMSQLLQDAADRGVQIKVLYNPATSYGNLELKDALVLFPAENCTIHTCVGNGKLKGFRKLMSPHAVFSYHHQKYLMADREWAMVTGCDVDSDRQPWLTLNSKNYYWLELSVVFNIRKLPQVQQFFENNWKHIVPPPLPLINSHMEHSLVQWLIRTANTYVHLEQQLFISNDKTTNHVAQALVERVVRAVREQDATFKCFVITNVRNPDDTPLLDFFLLMLFMWSWRWMESYAQKLGVTLPQFYEHIVFLHMEKDGFPIKIHSNIVIQDGVRCVRSSSNLTDRSLGSLPCDTELGIVVTDVAAIQGLQQTLWKRYCQVEDATAPPLTHLEFFSRAWSGQGLLRNVMSHALPNLFSVDYLSFLMTLLHDEPLFGNSKKIRWSVKKVKR